MTPITCSAIFFSPNSLARVSEPSPDNGTMMMMMVMMMVKMMVMMMVMMIMMDYPAKTNSYGGIYWYQLSSTWLCESLD